MSRRSTPVETNDRVPTGRYPPRTHLLTAPIHGKFALDTPVNQVQDALRRERHPPSHHPTVDQAPFARAYPPLYNLTAQPLLISELPGTHWVNIYTGGKMRIDRLDYNRDGYPIALRANEEITYPHVGVILWMPQPPRPLIENWLQVDLPNIQAGWRVPSGWHHLDFQAGHTHKLSPAYLTALADCYTWHRQGWINLRHILDIQTKYFGPVQTTLFD